MKTLPNRSLKWFSGLSDEEASQYKNKFVCYELKGDGLLKLTFFLNPMQSYDNHKAVATKKFHAMNKLKGMAKHRATQVSIDRTMNHLHTYIYQVDIEINEELLNEEIQSFTNELIANDRLSHIVEVNSNKPYAVCLALNENIGKYKELEKELKYQKNINSCYVFETYIITNIASQITNIKLAS